MSSILQTSFLGVFKNRDPEYLESVPTRGRDISLTHNIPHSCIPVVVVPDALIPEAGTCGMGELHGPSDTENTANIRSCYVYPSVYLHGALGSILGLSVINAKLLIYYQIKINQRQPRMCLFIFPPLPLCSSSPYWVLLHFLRHYFIVTEFIDHLVF